MSSSQSSSRQKAKPKPKPKPKLKAIQRPLTSQILGFDDKPLWNHVKVLNVVEDGDDVFETIKKEHVGAEARKAEQDLHARKKAEYISLLEGYVLPNRKIGKEWSQQPFINIMAASQSRAMFVKAIDASENIKDADYVASGDRFDIEGREVIQLAKLSLDEPDLEGVTFDDDDDDDVEVLDVDY
ncbi:hypothetical protein Vadar_003326 [Vaccinium darrowii]|uniref:Uncharacterized protein n=1 Tax=Vaccinium darrowii TaxID=229202 RepID=A0ACB7WXP3_9ERIC|nr:hypothetical protein Vadar_003326 [Vaccinium darrowii]